MSWIQIGNDIDGQATDDLSGYSIDISTDGNRVAIAAIRNNSNGQNSGHVRVWEFNGTEWVQIGSDIIGEAMFDAGFGTTTESGMSVSLSTDGDRVAVGAAFNSGNSSFSGHTRIWEFNGTDWTQIGNDIDSEKIGDRSGHAVSLSADGGRVAISADFNNDNGPRSGHVRIWEFNGTSWIQIGNDIDGEAPYDISGTSISLSSDGSRVAIGAPTNDGNGTDSGHVRVWEFNDTDWIQIGNDIEGLFDNESGHSVSLSGDGNRVAVGEYLNRDNGLFSGRTRIWEFNGTQWIQIGNDIEGAGSDERSGWSVSISTDGKRVAIGSINDDANGSNSGRVRIWEFNGTDWVQIGNDIDGEASGDQSGWYVSISGNGSRVSIGSIYNDGNGMDSGHVRVWEGFIPSQPEPEAEPEPTPEPEPEPTPEPEAEPEPTPEPETEPEPEPTPLVEPEPEPTPSVEPEPEPEPEPELEPMPDISDYIKKFFCLKEHYINITEILESRHNKSIVARIHLKKVISSIRCAINIIENIIFQLSLDFANKEIKISIASCTLIKEFYNLLKKNHHQLATLDHECNKVVNYEETDIVYYGVYLTPINCCGVLSTNYLKKVILDDGSSLNKILI